MENLSRQAGHGSVGGYVGLVRIAMVPIVVLTDERYSELVDTIHRTLEMRSVIFPKTSRGTPPDHIPFSPSLWIPERAVWVRRGHRASIELVFTNLSPVTSPSWMSFL